MKSGLPRGYDVWVSVDSSRQNGRVGMVALAVWMTALGGIVAVDGLVAVGTRVG